MTLGNYLFWPIYCIVGALPYFVVGRYTLDIQKYRNHLWWFFLAWGFFFGSIEFFAQAPNPEVIGASEYWIGSIAHAMSTFVALGTYAYLTDEFFPRTFIRIDIYLDLVTILTYAVYMPIENAIFKTFNIHTVATSIEAASKPVDLWLVVPYMLNVFAIMLVYKLLDDKIKTLLNKIPDFVCTLVFLGMFMGFIVSMVTIRRQFEEFNSTQGTYYEIFTLNRLFITLGCILILAMIMFALTNRRYMTNMKLESAMQYEYYKKVSEIHNDVRHLRHDISNHISAMNYAKEAGDDRYEQALKERCKQIRESLGEQQAWAGISSQVMSRREIYELCQYACGIAQKYCGNRAAATFAKSDADGFEHIEVNIPTSRGSVFLLKRSQTYGLIKSLVRIHSGSLEWSKTPDSLNLKISLPLNGVSTEESEVAHAL